MLELRIGILFENLNQRSGASLPVHRFGKVLESIDTGVWMSRH